MARTYNELFFALSSWTPLLKSFTQQNDQKKAYKKINIRVLDSNRE